MRAKMSDKAARVRILPVNPGQTTLERFQEACDWEARAILAETEPGTEGRIPDAIHHSVVYMNQRTMTHGTLLAEGQFALVESLAAFVEA